ncbi:MAG: type II toxin-antitoxin system death-on-curing family toxin [Proteobacteria bacterium]|nr:type II toxin-antitoxin system death-on-curing family toxin [Pseudomonadota bacterium]
MTGWRWVRADVVAAVHDRQIAEHGGADGARDPSAVASALARPENLAAAGKHDAADLAAAYAVGLVRHRGFADGNKRTAWVVARLFLAANGYRFPFDKVDAVRLVDAVAAGSLEEGSLAERIRQRLTTVPA